VKIIENKCYRPGQILITLKVYLTCYHCDKADTCVGMAYLPSRGGLAKSMTDLILCRSGVRRFWSGP